MMIMGKVLVFIMLANGTIGVEQLNARVLFDSVEECMALKNDALRLMASEPVAHGGILRCVTVQPD